MEFFYGCKFTSHRVVTGFSNFPTPSIESFFHRFLIEIFLNCLLIWVSKWINIRCPSRCGGGASENGGNPQPILIFSFLFSFSLNFPTLRCCSCSCPSLVSRKDGSQCSRNHGPRRVKETDRKYEISGHDGTMAPVEKHSRVSSHTHHEFTMCSSTGGRGGEFSGIGAVPAKIRVTRSANEIFTKAETSVYSPLFSEEEEEGEENSPRRKVCGQWGGGEASPVSVSSGKGRHKCSYSCPKRR